MTCHDDDDADGENDGKEKCHAKDKADDAEDDEDDNDDNDDNQDSDDDQDDVQGDIFAPQSWRLTPHTVTDKKKFDDLVKNRRSKTLQFTCPNLKGGEKRRADAAQGWLIQPKDV